MCFFGAVSDEKSHCCIAEWIDEDTFIRFVKYLLRVHGKLALIADRATHHFKSKKVKWFVGRNKGKIILWPLPKRLPELNPMEQGWKSSRANVTYKLFEDTKSLGRAVKSHIQREFEVNLFQFWS